MVRQKLANREGLKAVDVREAVNELQAKSLKLFEAAYRKMAEKNQQQQQSSGGSSSSSEETTKTSSEEEAEKKKQEGGSQ